MKIVATNVDASRPPEHRPTGTPPTPANNTTAVRAVVAITREWKQTRYTPD